MSLFTTVPLQTPELSMCDGSTQESSMVPSNPSLIDRNVSSFLSASDLGCMLLDSLHTQSAINNKYPDKVFGALNLRLNEDQVLTQAQSGDSDHFEHQEPLDDNETTISFFDKDMRDFEEELEAGPATKEYTSLRYYKVKHSNPKRRQLLDQALLNDD